MEDQYISYQQDKIIDNFNKGREDTATSFNKTLERYTHVNNLLDKPALSPQLTQFPLEIPTIQLGLPMFEGFTEEPLSYAVGMMNNSLDLKTTEILLLQLIGAIEKGNCLMDLMSSQKEITLS